MVVFAMGWESSSYSTLEAWSSLPALFPWWQWLLQEKVFQVPLPLCPAIPGLQRTAYMWCHSTLRYCTFIHPCDPHLKVLLWIIHYFQVLYLYPSLWSTLKSYIVKLSNTFRYFTFIHPCDSHIILLVILWSYPVLSGTLHLYIVVVRHVTGTGSGLLGGILRMVVQISALT